MMRTFFRQRFGKKLQKMLKKTSRSLSMRSSALAQLFDKNNFRAQAV
jgi:hypothetical protein